MRRFYRRRRRANWSFSDSFSISIDSATTIASFWLLPPGRVQFLLDTQKRDRMTFVAAHLWLDFFWKCDSTSAAQAIPDVDFAVYKTVFRDATGAAVDDTMMFGQWDQPATPATITSWAEDDDDGTEPFIWQHHIKGMTPPNAIVNVRNTGQGGGSDHAGNQGTLIDKKPTVDDASVFVCRKFMVSQEWQPDVVTRSKRRLEKGEGIAISMIAPTAPPAGVSAFLNVHERVLTS